MKLYRTQLGTIAQSEEGVRIIDFAFDELMLEEDPARIVADAFSNGTPASIDSQTILAPVADQEVWAAGVTYYKSRDARIEEAAAAGGGDFYDRVYAAERPELFYKSAPHKVVGPGDDVRIRRDATWSVPEAEVTLVVSPQGRIVGYTIGNDMSSRDIEGANPLYLPQAKVYDGACAIGPCILLQNDPLPQDTAIHMEVHRGGERVYSGSTTFSELKRSPGELVEYLYRETRFTNGCMLMTGTGIVPDSTFSLAHEDEIRITVEGIGTLSNRVA